MVVCSVLVRDERRKSLATWSRFATILFKSMEVVVGARLVRS
jgi:hypothetical protein